VKEGEFLHGGRGLEADILNFVLLKPGSAISSFSAAGGRTAAFEYFRNKHLEKIGRL